MSTQGLNADLPSPDGFDGTHGVAPKMWFIVDIPQLHIKLSKKRRKALKMQNIPKMENVRASSPHILHFSILTVLRAAKSTNIIRKHWKMRPIIMPYLKGFHDLVLRQIWLSSENCYST